MKENEGIYQGDAVDLLKAIYGDSESVYAQDFLKAQEFQNSLTNENTKTYFQNLSSEDQKDTMKLYVTGVIDQDATQAEIENGLENLKYSLDYDTTNLEMTATLRDKVVEGEDFEEELKKLREYNGMEYKEELEGFEEKSLKDKLEILEKITNEQQEQNLLAIAMKKDEKESEIRLKNKMAMQEELNNAISEKEKQEIRDNFTQSLEKELSELDSEIELELNTQILDYYLTQVDTIIGRTELLQKATEMIGEGWTIASEDARAFGDMYPELLDGCDILADGTIKLNQEMVKSKLEGDQAEIESDTTKLVTEMENQKVILGIQRKYAEKELEIIEATLNGEYSQAESEKLIQDNLSAYKEEISAYDTDIQAAGQAATIDNAEKASNEIQGHFNAVGEKLVQIQEAYRKLFTSEDINISDFKEILKSEEKAQDLTSGEDALTEYFDEQTYGEDKRKEILATYGAGSDELNKLAERRLELKKEIEGYTTAEADLTIGISEIKGNADKSKKGIENAGKSDEERDKEGKEYKDEFDRYWELNKVIEKTENELDKLSEMENHLFGKDLQKNLKETNKLLQNQIQHHKDLYAEQQREQKELQNILSTYGMSFDDKGNITNYLEVTKQMTDEYNALVSSYNNFGIDENQFNLGEEQFELFKETLERYDDLFYSEMVETLNNIDDEAREIIENNLKGWEAVIEVELDKEEFERDWNSFLKEMNEDYRMHYKDLNADLNLITLNASSYKDTMNIKGQQVADIQADLERIRKTGQGELYLTESEALEALRDAKKEYQDAIQDYVNSAQEAWDVYLEGIDQAYEKIDELMSQYDKMNEQLEFQGQLIELIYGEEAFDLIEQINAAKADTGLSQLRAIQAELDATNAAIKKEVEGTAVYNTLQEKQIELQSQLNDKILEMVQLYKDDLTNAINKALKEYEKFITNGTGFDYANEQWEKLRENSDFTLNATERAYEVASLSNNIQKDISNLTDLKDKEKLNAALQEEINLLKQKELLTQHDVDMAQARLDIIKAEIALEDARNSKNSMKLTRGTDGNWSYQYVANEEDIRDKTQSYIDSWNNYKNIAEEGYIEITEKITQIQENTKEKLLEIMNIEDEAERNRQLIELETEYYNQMDALAAEYNLRELGYIQANYGAYQTFTGDTKLSFQEMKEALDKETGEMFSIAKTFAETTLPEMTSIAAGFSDSWNGSGENSAKNQFKMAMQEIYTAFVDYQSNLDVLSKQTNVAFGETGIAGAINQATSGVKDLETAIRNLCNSELGGKLDTLRNKFTSLYNEVQKLLVDLGIVENKTKNPSSTANNGSTAKTNTNTNTANSSNTSAQKTTTTSSSQNAEWNHILEIYNKINSGAWTETGTKARIEKAKKEGYTELEMQKAQEYINLVYPKKEGGQGISKDKAKAMLGFDTGGYTGAWGSSGKLAILHEKELILNKQDTANILEAVKATRTDFIDRMMFSRLQNSIQLMSAQLEMAAKYNSFKNAIGKECDCPNQIFNVTAEFPAANSVAEIREAILSLPGLASQKVGMRSYSRV
jgi:hypothetical protein